jgi:hypothetical protein
MFGRKDQKECIAKWKEEIGDARTQRIEGIHSKVGGGKLVITLRKE